MSESIRSRSRRGSAGRSRRSSVAALLCLAFGFALGTAWAEEADAPLADDVARELATMHVDGPDEVALREAAVQGIIQWMKAHYGPEGLSIASSRDYEAWQAATTGEARGLGLEFEILPGYGIRLTEVFPDSPASDVGLQPGEVITAIRGRPVAGRSAREVLAALDRADPSAASLTVLGNDGLQREYQLAPKKYRIPNFIVREAGEYRILRILAFGPGFGQEIQAAVERAGKPVVLDLRDAGDGLLSEVLKGMGVFLGESRVVGSLRSGPVREKELRSAPGRATEQRVVLLVDEETHGLGEFFVAAIRRANPRVRVIGAPTAGEATLPGFIALGDAQHLRFPAQRLSLEDGSTWERRGLQPDLLVPGTHTSLLPPPSPPPDLQLDAAHHVIQAP